ncbi:MAG TPA: hypothetical protein PKM21_05625 [Anaerolineales bacterium]|nr:hypothetical protein [Anaerolineales bacterium]
MKQEPKKYDDDDGRVICNMNVEGMRWYDRRARGEKRAEGMVYPQGERLTRSETWQYAWYAVLAGLSVVLVISLTMVLFTLFCTHVWFR